MTSSLAKQEARNEELSRNIMTLREEIEQARVENQQMKIEREVWKTSEQRAVKEAQELLKERNGANERLRDLQRNLDDRERAQDSQFKRNEKMLEEISRDLQLSRKQLADLMDDHRTLTTRREAELKESKVKTERHNAELDRLRADLDASKSTEQSLNSKVQALSKALAEEKERVVVYKGRDASAGLPGPPNDPTRNISMALAQAKYTILSY
jgi:hypothetical protein